MNCIIVTKLKNQTSSTVNGFLHCFCFIFSEINLNADCISIRINVKKKLNDWNLQQNWKGKRKRKRNKKREKPHNKHRKKNTLDFQELTRYWFSHWKRFIWFERVHTFFDLRVINVSRVVMSFSMCLIHVRKRAWYFKSANFEWNKWKFLSRIPQMWPLHILFSRTMCCVFVCLFFFLSCTLLDSLNLWMLFIRRFTKRKHCTQKLKYAADTSEREKKIRIYQVTYNFDCFSYKRK